MDNSWQHGGVLEGTLSTRGVWLTPPGSTSEDILATMDFTNGNVFVSWEVSSDWAVGMCVCVCVLVFSVLFFPNPLKSPAYTHPLTYIFTPPLIRFLKDLLKRMSLLYTT